MKSAKPKLLSESIATLVNRLGLGKKIKQYEVLDVWPEIVGEQIAKVAIAERIDNGKLFVHVEQATWRNELVFLKQELIAKINSTMKQEVVKDIIFR